MYKIEIESISKNILSRMQGGIRVKSRINRGSDFIVAFPAQVLQEVETITSSEDAEVSGAESLRGKSYLLLDDVAENTYILASLLKRYGVRSSVWQNGVDALEAYKESPMQFDGIITDLRMPMMSGQTFVQEIRRFERQLGGRRVPIIVITAEAAIEEKRLCLTQYGANEFLLKPVKLRELMFALVRMHVSADQGKQKHEKKKSILIVDDDTVGSRFLSTMLTKAGHRCEQAFSVHDGLRLVAEKPQFDIVILDSQLGDGTGPDFLRLLDEKQTEGRRRGMKVISVSGNDVREQKRMYEAGGCGVDGYLQKPARKQEMLGLIQVL